MNLKEAFRYQTFLSRMMDCASTSIMREDYSLTTVKTHKKKQANPDAEDMEETVQRDRAYIPNDSVIAFMIYLVRERTALTVAINEAKTSVGIDIDAMIEANKFRQSACAAIKSMLRFTASKSTTPGRDYKFNVEGNQVPYYYDVEVVTSEAFDRAKAKFSMRGMASESDTVSTEIDAAMVNTDVNYVPDFDVNDTFEDVMNEFIKEEYRT